MRLKYFDFDSSFSMRSKYYKAMGKTDTYTGSASQNAWMIQQMRQNGYKKGGTIGELIKRTGEDGFVLAREGETIITPESVAQFKKAFEAMNPIVKSLESFSKLPDFSTIPKNEISSIQIGDIQMYGVNKPEEFAQQLKYALQHDKSVTKIIQADTLGIMSGKNSLAKLKY